MLKFMYFLLGLSKTRCVPEFNTLLLPTEKLVAITLSNDWLTLFLFLKSWDIDYSTLKGNIGMV